MRQRSRSLNKQQMIDAITEKNMEHKIPYGEVYKDVLAVYEELGLAASPPARKVSMASPSAEPPIPGATGGVRVRPDASFTPVKGGVPKGYHPDVWWLAEVFKKGAEHHRVSVIGIPIIYKEILHCLEHDESLPEGNPRSVSRVEKMIVFFWNHWNHFDLSLDSLGKKALSTFTGFDVWDYCRDITRDTDKWEAISEGIADGTIVLPTPQKLGPAIRKKKPTKAVPRIGYQPGDGIRMAKEVLQRRAETDERGTNPSNEDN